MLTRITVIVITTLTSLPRAIATIDSPRNSAAPPARRAGSSPASPWTSGPLAATTPTRASTIPSICRALGCSPCARPTANGTSTPRAAMGDTTPIVPIASAR